MNDVAKDPAHQTHAHSIEIKVKVNIEIKCI